MGYTKLFLVHILISLIPIYFILPFTLQAEIDYCRERHMKRKDRKKARDHANSMWGILILALIFCSIDIVPLIPHFVDPQYECVSGDYEMGKSGREDIIIVTTENGEEKAFYPLKGFKYITGEPYPFDECEVELWYTRHGNYAVDVIVRN